MIVENDAGMTKYAKVCKFLPVGNEHLTVRFNLHNKTVYIPSHPRSTALNMQFAKLRHEPDSAYTIFQLCRLLVYDDHVKVIPHQNVVCG